MDDFFLLCERQMAQMEAYFPLSHGVPRVDDRRVVSGIVYVIRNAIDAVVREAVAGVILCSLLAAVSVSIELARKRADSFGNQAHGLKNCGNLEGGMRSNRNTRSSRQRAE
ncbi:hypothetical protein [Bosea sp. TAF32]|uniref:hypothetical protein n=1 Tax=Bosea sp. TAF32 TaxID=3237482 RepID=UPI003F920C4C